MNSSTLWLRLVILALFQSVFSYCAFAGTEAASEASESWDVPRPNYSVEPQIAQINAGILALMLESFVNVISKF